MVAMNLPGAQVAAVARALPSLPTFRRNPEADAYGLAARFRVRVAELTDLGKWSGCTGLGVTFKPDEFVQAGDYTSPIYLPGDIAYGEVTLSRAMQKETSGQVRKMLQRMVDEWADWDGDKLTFTGTSVIITLLDSQGAHEICSWTLANAYPKAWTGPDMSGTSNEVAIEKIQFAHRGFLTRKAR